MKALYDHLEETYVVGPKVLVNGQEQFKPFAEYPKWVENAAGERKVVKDLREEAQFVGSEPAAPKEDPLAAEREKLGRESERVSREADDFVKAKDELAQELDRIKALRAELEAQVAKPTKVNVPDAPATTSGAKTNANAPMSNTPAANRASVGVAKT